MVAAVTRARLDPRPSLSGGPLGRYPPFRWKAAR